MPLTVLRIFSSAHCPLLLFFFFSLPLTVFSLDYTVEFEGLHDHAALSTLSSVSQLVLLQKRPPASLNALRYRADSDLPVLLKVLSARGYYEAQVSIQIQEQEGRHQVILQIDPGPLYTLETYEVHLVCQEECCLVDSQTLKIPLGGPAGADAIFQAELASLEALGRCGYPLCEVEGREVVVDGQTKTVRVSLFVSSLSRCRFGTTSLMGESQVKPLYIERKILWKEGEIYNSDLTQKTQDRLIGSGLFSSVLITHGPGISDEGELPMKIEVVENKYRSVSVGVSYQTVFGPGLTLGWENRNIAGMGRRLSVQGDLTRISQTGIATYVHPDCFLIDQDLILEGEAAHEVIYAYAMRSYSESNRLDSKYGKRLRFSLGVEGERLFVTDSVDNGSYWLLEIPLYMRWSTANDLLNPTQGVTLQGLLTPTVNIDRKTSYYAIQEITESAYFPLNKSHSLVIAEECSIGMGWYSDFSAIALPKRFLGGSEQELRGYRYRTVSPLIGDKPTGGGSALYGTVEARFRVSKEIGLVPFFDVGNVYKARFPKFTGKWFKSVGLGIRYFSFMGPFRLDVAFPLNRRKGIDPVYKILVSIGQTF